MFSKVLLLLLGHLSDSLVVKMNIFKSFFENSCNDILKK